VRSPIRALLSAGMNKARRNRLKAAAAAFASNAVNGNLRRAQLSFLGAWTAEWAFTVALGIVAYRDGGATAVGLVGLLRMVPSAVVAPLYSSQDRNWGGWNCRHHRRPTGDRLRARRALDYRGDSLPTRTFRTAPVAAPNRA
jgi:hypothetical protein